MITEIGMKNANKRASVGPIVDGLQKRELWRAWTVVKVVLMQLSLFFSR